MRLPERNGPALWDNLLDIVGHHWNPVVAGGAIRDYFLEVEPKDVDIFVPAEYVEDFTSVIEGLPGHCTHGRIIWAQVEGILTEDEREALEGAGVGNLAEVDSYAGDGFAPDLIAVWEGEILGIPVNIIGRRALEDGPQALVDTFDFDIVKAYHTTAGITVTTGPFSTDLVNRTATLAHGLSYDQSVQRWARFNERNPGLLRLNLEVVHPGA